MKEKKNDIKWLFINQVWLVKNVPFFLYLSVLAVVYIYNVHHAEKAIKDINKTTKDLKNQQYEFKMVMSDWMFITQQSEVVKAVEASGIKKVLEPPIAIQDSLENEERKTK
jgi:hypothetical protein